MPNFRRSTWTPRLLIRLLAPLSVIFFFTLTCSAGSSAPLPPQASDLSQSLLGSPPTLAMSRAAAPLQVAGDAHTLWVAHPVLLQEPGKKVPAFELLARTSNTRTWTLAHDDREDQQFLSFPRGLAVVNSPPGDSSRCTPYVFSDVDGEVYSFTTTSKTLRAKLPSDHQLLATAGSAYGIFAITVGIPPTGATHPGDTLSLTVLPGENSQATATSPAPSSTQPASASRPAEASQPASAPATSSQPATSSRPTSPQINAYWFHEGHWTVLPPLGPAGAALLTPNGDAHIGLAQQGHRLVVMWVDREHPELLHLRTLEYAKDKAEWSAPVASHLSEPVPAESRLLPVMLDQVLYVFWPELAPATHTLELRGGRVDADASDPLPTANLLPPLSLAQSGEGLKPATDVAIGPAENSIAAIVNMPDNTLTCTVFTTRGTVSSGPTTVKPESPSRDILLAQNIAILLLIVMLTLSFWQWRQRPGPLKLPQGMMIARPMLRAVAFLIDIGIPYVAVCTFFGLWQGGGYLTLISTAGNSILNLQMLISSPELMTLLGLYLGHVTLGELFFYRSIGKAVTGLQVAMIDGKPPTLAATVVRNLIRLPELVLGLLVIYMFLSQSRQRLGDLVARTIVISHEPPDAVRKPPEEQ